MKPEKLMSRWFCTILSFFYCCTAYSFDSQSFMDSVQQEGAIYREFSSSEDTKRMFAEGKIGEANEQLESLVPDKDKSLYDSFVLGNMLFLNDFDASYRYMKSAEEKDSDNPYVLFERGIHEHRLENYETAKGYYQRVKRSSLGDNNPALDAYLTHVYLMTGNVSEAFDSWDAADFGSNHTRIEKAMYTIFSGPGQDLEREALISDIKAGDAFKLCDLYKLDSNWETDWWNYAPRQFYLEYDRTLAHQVLLPGSVDERYFSFCSSSEKLEDEMYIQKLKDIGVLGSQGKLPESSSLTYDIVRNLTSRGLLTPEEILAQFETQLVSYSKRHPSEKRYYEVLAFLYVRTGNQDKLRSVDRYGWKELRMATFAASYIAGIDPNSKDYRIALEEALEDFPLSTHINAFALDAELPNQETAMARYVASQFTDVKNNWAGPYRLSDFMASLRHELENTH